MAVPRLARRLLPAEAAAAALAGALRRSTSPRSRATTPSTGCPSGRPSRSGATARPTDFRWAVKASRFLTHIKRLREPEEPVGRLMERAAGLGDKLDTILLQLPPTLKADADLLRECLAQFPAGTRVAVEPRHDSWWTDEIRAPARALRRGAVLGRPRRGAGRPALAHRRLGLPALPPRLRGVALPAADAAAVGRAAGRDLAGRPGRARLLQQRPGVRGGARRRPLRRGGPADRPGADPRAQRRPGDRRGRGPAA